jgi:AraC family transcriptional regulator
MTHALESRELAGFRMTESLYPARLRQPRHSHTLPSFSFVLAGSYLETFGARPAMRQPSTLVFHPPQESHAVEYEDRPVRILSVRMDAPRFSYFTDHAAIFESHVSARTETINWIGHRLYKEFRHADDLSTLAVEGLVCDALVEAVRTHARSKVSSPSWLRQAEDYLRDNFSQPFRFEDVAKAAGVHPAHLSRVFRRNHGCTVGEYVRRLRLDFAVDALVNPHSSLAEVASAAGFADQSHLTRTFRSYFGVTPSEYRRLHRR